MGRDAGGSSGRISYFDNLKGLLIFLVVVGHLALMAPNSNWAVESMSNIIYSFHMPLFVFVSGFFAKRVFSEGYLRGEKVVSLVVMALVFQFVVLVLDNGLDMRVVEMLLVFNGAPWYLVSLASWYMLTPFFARVKPLAAVSIAFVLSFVSGFAAGMGDTLAIVRTVNFLPYYLLGYYCSTDTLLKVRRSRVTWLAAVVALFVIVACAVLAQGPIFECLGPSIYGNAPYNPNHCLDDFVKRLATTMMALLLSVSVIRIVPERGVGFLRIAGERTLQIYILHRVVKSFLAKADFGNSPVLADDVAGCAVVLGVSLLLTVVCSIKPLGVPFNALMKYRWPFLFKAREK